VQSPLKCYNLIGFSATILTTSFVENRKMAYSCIAARCAAWRISLLSRVLVMIVTSLFSYISRPPLLMLLANSLHFLCDGRTITLVRDQR